MKTISIERKIKGIEILKTSFNDGRVKTLYNIKVKNKNIPITRQTFNTIEGLNAKQVEIFVTELLLEI